MLTTEELENLLKQPESDTLDFKKTVYKISEEEGKAALIKDVICLANTPRQVTSFILLGVERKSDGSTSIEGVTEIIDDEIIQSQFSEKVYPLPKFAYYTVDYRGFKLSVIEVPPTKIGPIMPVKDYPGGRNILREKVVYFRRGSKNDIANSDDIKNIVNWLNEKNKITSNISSEEPPLWDRLVEAVHAFDPQRKYILLSGDYSDKDLDNMRNLGKLPWSAVFDFNPNSDINGLVSRVKTVLETYRGLYLMVKGDRISFTPDKATYWYFARGLNGREGTLETSGWKNWKKAYSTDISEQLRRLASGILPTPVTCIVLGFDAMLASHLRSTLEDALGLFGDAIEFVIVTDDKTDFHALGSELGAQVIEMPISHLCSGLNLLLSHDDISSPDNYLLPSSSGIPMLIELKDQKWLEEELEIIHLNSGLKRPDSRIIGREFLRGNQITWFELGLHDDVEREKTEKLVKLVKRDLDNKRAVRINLYHAPGGGGTTVARRCVWDLHRDYPCVLLTKSVGAETAERLYKLSSITSLPVLLVIDGAQVSERQVDEVFDQLRSRQIPVVVLQVSRRYKSRVTESVRSLFLDDELSTWETSKFVEVFSRYEPFKRSRLETLATSPNPKQRTAFYIGLETFEKDFIGLEEYVKTRISGLTDIQKKVMLYVAIAYHYGQQPVKSQAFAELLGIPKNRIVHLSDSLPEGARELLIEAEREVWRISHDLIAAEVIEQLLIGESADRRIWYQNLPSVSKEFIEFCRGNDAVASEEMLEIVRRVYIYRDNKDVLGTEQSAGHNFSSLMEDIKSREGKLGVMIALVDSYPEEAHFWAHLGRFYAIDMKNYQKAAECIEKAIKYQDKDHVLHHMMGMVLRYQVYSAIEQNGEISEIVKLMKSACGYFANSRVLKPEDEHGYISEIQLITRVLDYAARSHPGGFSDLILSSKFDPFLRESLERAEELLEHVRRNREGEGASNFEQECRAHLDALYGKHRQALVTFDNLLSRPDVYKPPIRRQIVWTYLARENRNWAALSADEIFRSIELLNLNLREEPNSDKNLRLWVQAVRRSNVPPSVEEVIERVGYWKANAGTLDAVYYLYVFYALLALEGSTLARNDCQRFIEECSQLAKFRRNRHKSIEWYGKGEGINRLIHHSELGEWVTNDNFWEKPTRLERVQGRIAKIEAPQTGTIEVNGGLYAFYVPALGGGYSRDRLNRLVDFYLGFSYDGLRAWNIKDL